MAILYSPREILEMSYEECLICANAFHLSQKTHYAILSLELALIKEDKQDDSNFLQNPHLLLAGEYFSLHGKNELYLPQEIQEQFIDYKKIIRNQIPVLSDTEIQERLETMLEAEKYVRMSLRKQGINLPTKAHDFKQAQAEEEERQTNIDKRYISKKNIENSILHLSDAKPFNSELVYNTEARNLANGIILYLKLNNQIDTHILHALFPGFNSQKQKVIENAN